MRNLKTLPGWFARGGLVLLAFVALSCGDDDDGGTNPPTTGSISVTATTSGDEQDTDGYTISVDGGPTQPIGANGTLTVSDQSAGDHTVALGGVAANCTVAGDNPRTVAVTAGATATTTFSVTCSATVGDLEVTTVTTGDDIDADGFTVSLDGGLGQAIDVNGTLNLPGLAPGDYSVELGDVAANCSVSGDNPRTVTVAAGGTASTQFDVSCSQIAPATGDLKVVNVTTGNTLDDAYTVSIDGGTAQALAANDSLTAADLGVGDHTVELGDVAANCTVSGDNPRTVTVTEAAEVRTQFDVSCTGGTLDITTSTWGVGLDADGFDIVIDGGDPQSVAINETQSFPVSVGDHTVELQNIAANCTVQNGTNPRTETVSDGSATPTQFDVFCFQALDNHIVFTSLRDGEQEIFVKEIGGTTAQRLTNNDVVDGRADVAPDGSAVVFQSDRAGSPDVWKMSVAGFEPLADGPTTTETDPAWAADGSFIAYTSGSRVNLMAPDGSSKSALSSGGGDSQPAVSPDGAWVVFQSTRDGDGNLYVVNVATLVETQLTSDPGLDAKPEWWFDGSKILWASSRSGNMEIYVADFDAGTIVISNITNLSNHPDSDLMPDMKPDGSSIAFVSNRDGTNDVWTMDPDGTNQVKFEGSDSAADNDPSWSP